MNLPEIYISKYNKNGEFHHSSFLSGEKVAAAGDIIIKDGVIKQVTNNSGHYTPLLKDVKKNLLDELDFRDYLLNNKLWGEKLEESIKFLNH